MSSEYNDAASWAREHEWEEGDTMNIKDGLLTEAEIQIFFNKSAWPSDFEFADAAARKMAWTLAKMVEDRAGMVGISIQSAQAWSSCSDQIAQWLVDAGIEEWGTAPETHGLGDRSDRIMSIEALRLNNAGAQLPCQSAIHPGHEHDYDTAEVACKDGWVYALPNMVRISHPDRDDNVWEVCVACRRGWVPATDGWVWWSILREYELRMRFNEVKNFTNPLWYDDPELAFHTTLNKALEAMGARFRS